MAESKDEKWAGWPEKKEESSKEQSTKTNDTNLEYLLLSEQVQSAFLKLDIGELGTKHKDKKVIPDGNLSLDRRAYLAMLLSDVASMKESITKDQKNALCCAEFYAEFFPAKLHRHLTETNLLERLTLAIRRSRLACGARDDARLIGWKNKIPRFSSENPDADDPLTLREVFWTIVSVCEMEAAKKEIVKVRRRNLSLLTIAICRQGSLGRKISDKIKMIGEEFKISDWDLTPGAIEQLWNMYGRHIVLPPAHVPMLDYVNTGEKQAGKTGETAEAKEEDVAGARAENDDEVDELSKLLDDVKISTNEKSWASFFQRLAKRCKISRNLQLFVKQVGSGGALTVLYHFRKAYENFPDFDWIMAFSEFPDEQIKLWKVMEDLTVDPFLHYRKPMTNSHVDYLHLGYLGVQLQEKVGGVSALSDYKGFVKFYNKMPRRRDVDRWVAIYSRCWDEEPVTVEYKDPTLKYANFVIPDGKGTADKYARFQEQRNRRDAAQYAEPRSKAQQRYKNYSYDEGYYGDHGYDDYNYYQGGYSDYYDNQTGYNHSGYYDNQSGYNESGYNDYSPQKQQSRGDYYGGRGDGHYNESSGGYGGYGGYGDHGGTSDYYRGLRDGYMKAQRANRGGRGRGTRK